MPDLVPPRIRPQTGTSFGAVAGVLLLTCCAALAEKPSAALSIAPATVPSLVPARLPRIGTVDARFQSYNIEMVEITGGRFWKPYDGQTTSPPGTDTSADADRYADRPPIDLSNPRLRRLAAALAPAYLRISGTWANSTYFADSGDAPSKPPAGFQGVLNYRRWRDVIDFARAVDARLVTSFAISPGTRDAAGIWKPDQARRFLAATRALGGRIAAAEFMNEPMLATAMGGAPQGYDASAYGRDFKVFHRFVKATVPGMLILGPGTVGEPATASDLLAASGARIDVLSYHFYGAVSQRCGGRRTPDDALSEAWLTGTDHAIAFYRGLRDRFAPGKPIWLTETAEAACGGNPWAATFLDTFRYLDQLGRLAKAGVGVVMHNTLAASDYALLDERTFAPRPNYWAALLWRQLMGTTVLDAGVSIDAGLHVYAHCRRDAPGVTFLVINTDRDAAHALTLSDASKRYTLDAGDARNVSVRLNGRTLTLGAKNDLPHIAGIRTSAGLVSFAPTTITFLVVPSANNRACR
jgi:heparanase